MIFNLQGEGCILANWIYYIPQLSDPTGILLDFLKWVLICICYRILNCIIKEEFHAYSDNIYGPIGGDCIDGL